MREEVFVTGCGFVSPLGSDYQTLWANLKAGKSGVRHIDVIDGSRVSMAARVEAYHLDLDEKEARKYDPFIQYAFQATKTPLQTLNLILNCLPPPGLQLLYHQALVGYRQSRTITTSSRCLQGGYPHFSFLGPLLI